jgi:predicted amidohydrolase
MLINFFAASFNTRNGLRVYLAMSKAFHRIVTISMATLEACQPPYNLSVPEPADNIARVLDCIDTAAATGADLICLPESAALAGRPLSDIPLCADEIAPQSGLLQVCAAAARFKVNIIFGTFARINSQPGCFRNCSVFIGRDGRVMGHYCKRRPVEEELQQGVLPGALPVVIDSDCGRVGLLICFDINFPLLWAETAAAGCDFIVWISAFEGGIPLPSYAWTHKMPIVSSVYSYHAKIIDLTGRVVDSTSRWHRLASWDLPIQRALCHTDHQPLVLQQLQKVGGRRIRVSAFSEEHVFLVEALDASIDLPSFLVQHNVVTYRDYIARCNSKCEALVQ